MRAVLSASIVLLAALVVLPSTAAAQRVAQPAGEPLSAEAFEKLKKLALASDSKVLIPPGIKKEFGLSENQRIECRQIGVELDGEKHFFAVRTGGDDEVFLSVKAPEDAFARAGRATGNIGPSSAKYRGSLTVYTYKTNSKLKLRGAAMSVEGDPNVHHVIPTDAEAGFVHALEIWARVAESQ
jgi:hypothetical protein